MDTPVIYDVLTVGKGNAALCAALTAHDAGAKVAMLEVAPRHLSGGNSRFAGGALRFVYSKVEELRRLTDISDEEVANTVYDTNTVDEYFDDMFRITGYRTDADLCETVIRNSYETMLWYRSKGVGFTPNYLMASQVIDGKRHFFNRMPVSPAGGGEGLVEALDRAIEKVGIEVFYETRAIALLYDGTRVTGVRAIQNGKIREFRAKTVVMAAGGFEANPEMRARYLGPGWELAKVRGSRFNMGEGLKMALEIGACPYGNWSGRHTTPWERNAPEYGDVTLLHSFYRQSFPIGVMINADGKRFVDEGADFYGYTYAKYGEAILKQPGQFAYQIFDAKVKKYVRPEYADKRVTKVSADTLEELAAKLEGVNGEAFLKTMRAFNAAVRQKGPINPAVHDGNRTEGLDVDKTNWAYAYDAPPFEAYNVTCGITFTFGGLRIDPKTAQVFDVAMNPIGGLYTAGEMVGGLFYFNYAAGSALVSGAVFGRIAGASAAAAARQLG